MTKQEAIEKCKDQIMLYKEVFIPDVGTVTVDDVNVQQINTINSDTVVTDNTEGSENNG
ncbi:hypothetical protein [Thermoanaerobacterium sp. PSU-2]|uniref:hypothetical protein n=1 Tax=Thermoanaerobacterium sp. PSU-2 TaxID=1930849 RepID=UPI0014397F75|nr:hypothetical protein [Thermoanaerobacterium sp. PSU-2]